MTFLRLLLPHVQPTACCAAASARAVAARHGGGGGGGRIFSTLANGELAKLVQAFAYDTN